MFQVHISGPDSKSCTELVEDTSTLIGKSRDCRVKLAGWRVGREHARIYRTKAGLFVQDLGQFTGTLVNGQRVEHHGPLTLADRISIGPYEIRVEDKLLSGSPGEIVDILANAPPKPNPDVRPARQDAGRFQHTPHHFWRRRLHEQLLDTIDLRRRDLLRMEDKQLRTETESVIREILDKETALPDSIDRESLVRDVLNEAVGLGPLEDLLADDSITEIMVNRHDEIYIERGGCIERHPLSFTSERAVLGVIERIVAPMGRHIDESSPMVDTRLKDGSRVNAVIPPLAIKGPTLTIRKFPQHALTEQNLISYGSLDHKMAGFLELAVRHKKSLLVSGGTGTGKTTLLNVLSNFIPDGERIITIEDAAELRLAHSHLIQLEARPANAEGRGQVAIRDLVRNALRMRPDRIVVGECRGGEALDMLQAMNTGHEGSLTTLHANSPRDALARLETMVLMAGMELPLAAIREQIASAIDIIVQLTRLQDGRRIVSNVVEVTGMEAGKIQMQELFRFEHRGRNAKGGVEGCFVGCETIPAFYDTLRESGVPVDLAIFGREMAA
jgi:pilus assembly protein CpaF